MNHLKVIRKGCSHSYTPADSIMPPITVVTQLSIDRLERLYILCSSWDGPVIAAILDEDRVSGGEKMNRFAANKSKVLVSDLENKVYALSVSKTSACMLQTILLKRTRTIRKNIIGNDEQPEQLLDHLYPINELRNVALNAAKSEFILLLDVDCVLSKDALMILSGWSFHKNDPLSVAFSDRLSVLRSLCIETPGAIVIPCFEANTKGNVEISSDNSWQSVLRRYAFPSNNESLSITRSSDSVLFSCAEVVDVYNSSRDDEDESSFSVSPFMSARFPRSHRATDFSQLLQVWAERRKESQSTSQETLPIRYYPIQYEEGFEPYILMSRAYVCGYESRLSGYGRNKCLHIYHLHRLGIKFWVCADVFALHVPHPPSHDRELVLGTESNSRDHVLLDAVKARYNKSRAIISTSCSIWALDEDIKRHPPFTISRERLSCRAPSSRRACIGTSIAWWPESIQSDLIGSLGLTAFLNHSLEMAAEDESNGKGSKSIEGLSAAVLTNLCSMHMHYDTPQLMTTRYYGLSDPLPHSVPNPHAVPVTVWLVTHLSVDRIDKLRSLCLHWRGPIAASIWMQPTLSSTDRKVALRDIQRLVDDTKGDKNLFSCDLRAVRAENKFTGSYTDKVSSFFSFSHLTSSQSVLSAELYPVNALRGAALDIVIECVGGSNEYKNINCNTTSNTGNENIPTPSSISNTVVFVIDVDMRPPDLLCFTLGNHEHLNSEDNNMLAIIYQQCVVEEKFLVIPALELYQPDEQSEDDAGDEADSINELLHSSDVLQLRNLFTSLIATKRIRAFHSSSFFRGHCATLTERWLANVTASLVPRDIPLVPLSYQEGWEPYGLIGLGLLMRMGGFNRSFVGWHRDKIEFIRRLSAYSVGFVICEDIRGFIVDWQPHAPTESRRQTEKGLYVCAMEGLYLRCCRQMEKLNELSAEDAYRSDSGRPLDIQADTPQSLLLTECLSNTSYNALPLILKCSNNPVEQGMFFDSNTRCRVLSNDLSRAPISWKNICNDATLTKELHGGSNCASNDPTNPANGGVYSVCVGEGQGGTLVAPAKGISLNIRIQESSMEGVLSTPGQITNMIKMEYSSAESVSKYNADCTFDPSPIVIKSLGLRFDLFVPPNLNIAATKGCCLPGLNGIVIATPTNGTGSEPGSFLFDARFRINTKGALVFKVTCSNWSKLTHSPLSSESCVRCLVTSTARVQRNAWQSFSVVVTDSAFIHATVDHSTIFAARLGFEGLEWGAIPVGVKLCVFCVDGSQLGEEVSLLLRNIQIAGKI